MVTKYWVGRPHVEGTVRYADSLSEAITERELACSVGLRACQIVPAGDEEWWALGYLNNTDQEIWYKDPR